MNTLQTLLLVVQVLVAISLIGLILIQHGKGADAGAAFGSGASNTVFGAQGSGNFLTRTTSILALIFLVNSMALAYIANQRVAVSGSLMDQPLPAVSQPAQQQAVPAGEIPAEPPAGTQSEVPAVPE
jgi:preprotein translocase subunit SecG